MDHLESPSADSAQNTLPIGFVLPHSVLKGGLAELVKAANVEDVKSIRDKAEAVRKYAQNAKLGLELQNQAAELKIRAERKAGNLLNSMKLRGGNRKSKSQSATLKKIGITKHQSSRWQQMATVSEREFTAWVDECRKSDRELTSSSVLRMARHGSRSETSSTRGTDESPIAQEIQELLDHTQTLESIILPVISSEHAVELRQVERRVICRLLKDLKKLIASVDKSVSKMATTLGD